MGGDCAYKCPPDSKYENKNQKASIALLNREYEEEKQRRQRAKYNTIVRLLSFDLSKKIDNYAMHGSLDGKRAENLFFCQFIDRYHTFNLRV